MRAILDTVVPIQYHYHYHCKHIEISRTSSSSMYMYIHILMKMEGGKVTRVSGRTSFPRFRLQYLPHHPPSHLFFLLTSLFLRFGLFFCFGWVAA